MNKHSRKIHTESKQVVAREKSNGEMKRKKGNYMR